MLRKVYSQIGRGNIEEILKVGSTYCLRHGGLLYRRSGLTPKLLEYRPGRVEETFKPRSTHSLRRGGLLYRRSEITSELLDYRPEQFWAALDTSTANIG